jgi:hypothetical protein
MKYPKKLITAPSDKTNQVGVTSAMRPERTPALVPMSLKKLTKFKVLWSYPSSDLRTLEYRPNMYGVPTVDMIRNDANTMNHGPVSTWMMKLFLLAELLPPPPVLSLAASIGFSLSDNPNSWNRFLKVNT